MLNRLFGGTAAQIFNESTFSLYQLFATSVTSTHSHHTLELAKYK
jgi:hypothetical protein